MEGKVSFLHQERHVTFQFLRLLESRGLFITSSSGSNLPGSCGSTVLKHVSFKGYVLP